ncbi:MAG: PQQ-binding-like beta-propeller repeat protein [Acidobacteriota bacterium]
MIRMRPLCVGSSILMAALGVAGLAGAPPAHAPSGTLRGTPPPAAAASANWPQWRGPGSSGVSPEVNLPSHWDATTNIAWKTAVPGKGHSSPIVWGNRVFLTTAIEGAVVPGAKAPVHMVDGKPWSHPEAMGADRRHTLKVLAVDAGTGRVVWDRVAYDGLMSDSRHAKASYASPTPLTDGEMVYAYFGSEGLFAYDFNGVLQWKVAFAQIGTVSVGLGTSPVLYRDSIIILCDNEDGPDSFIVALDKKSGKQLWKTPRKGIEVSWATPIVLAANGRDELVASGNQAIVAYNPATGQELWRAKGLDSNAVPSSVAGADLVYLFSGYPTKKVVAIRPGGSGDISGTPRVAWTYDRGVAYVASPVLYQGLLYLVSDKGIVSCLDARTGEVKYQDGRPPAPSSYTASLVAADGKIFEFSEDGDTFVVNAGPRHNIVARNSIGEAIYATPAIAGGRIYIRGAEHLFAIGK